jgi:hypothetical protein
VVLTAGQTLEAVREAAGDAARAVLLRSHQDMAALSSRGSHRVVDCGHGIQWERPDAVVEAVREVLAQSSPGGGSA